MSRWMIPFWWACWIAWQTGTNSSSRCRGVSRCSSQYVGDRHALDQLHDEVGPAGLGRAGVEHLGDVGVVHQGQGLALGLEPGDDLAGVHAGLMILRATLRRTGCSLLGHPDLAHAPLADLLQQLVGADDGAGAFARSGLARRAAVGGGRGLEEPARPEVGLQQGLDLRRSSGSASGRPVEEGGTFLVGRSSPGLRQKIVSMPGSTAAMAHLPAGLEPSNRSMRENGSKWLT